MFVFNFFFVLKSQKSPSISVFSFVLFLFLLATEQLAEDGRCDAGALEVEARLRVAASGIAHKEVAGAAGNHHRELGHHGQMAQR